MVRRVVGWVVLLGAVIGVGACTGEPSPGPTTVTVAPTESTAASPTPPAKPERPEAMERDDAEGAAAAAQYFIEMYPYVMATGDTAEFEAMSHDACGFCVDTLSQANQIKNRDETWTGGEITSSLVESYEQDALTGIFPLDVDIDQEQAVITDAAGSVVFTGVPERAQYRVEIAQRDGEWLVVEIAPRPES
ncbi:DUF6318 family protein [Antribacter gilvus]|uniref:DUF6318 family protein n=1 Tax=Antribacter gilvus TaxID=2304675 RepID=UPI000F782255|nr:DUF6318 family protein [Antribacter gilvus]